MPEKSPALLIRADAHTSIGAGHVMRCLALAQQWQDVGGRCHFVMAMDAGPLFERLEQESCIVHRIAAEPGSDDDQRQTIDIAQGIGAEWLVLDGYHFPSSYQKAIKDAKFKLLVIDDNSEHDHYFADLVLNQNIHADESLYPPEKIEPYTQLLLGIRYCLLRREFLKYRDIKRQIAEKATRIMVTMGAGDPKNITPKVLEAIGQLNDDQLHVKVIVGGNNTHYEQVAEVSQGLPCRCELIRNADDKTMAETMRWADLAVSAAGSTVWELCLLQTPLIALSIADNQVQIADRLERQKMSVSVDSRDAFGNIKLLVKAIKRAEDSRTRRTINNHQKDFAGVDMMGIIAQKLQ